ncbi:hypothetical protein M378DRAFT_16589 [Amanita muscaria Koide BX008]|uniref:Uncharacterized protein n=1 Tax=Amanita muscaria (strain Koide BX008) TaxID=946122 RepID=A0A0C2SSH6_AMAMK|nr:hypothetical protein M378DRAFT_16589 [Amanita muscaria Koide BX008]
MTDVGEGALAQSPEDSTRVASSAPDASLASSASVHEQVGSSDVPSPKNTQGSSLRAIVHATRVMTSDYGSVLVDYGKYVGPQVVVLGMLTSTKSDNKFRSLSMGEAAMSLRAVASSTARDKDERQASRGGRGNLMQQVASLLFGTLRSSNNTGEKTITPRRGPHSGAAITTSATTVNASTPTKRSSMPLESIIPCQPSHQSAISNPSTSKPDSSAARPAVPAPACLTWVKIADRQEGNNWLWDAFLKQRSSRSKPVRAEQPHHASFTGGSATMANGSASLLGDVAAILGRKITGGTRGGNEDEEVGRTMPLNVFFGGDDVGLGKLRRVLTAYSRGILSMHESCCLNCYLYLPTRKTPSGLSAAIVERILPEDFFSPSLLPSRACPLVLLDYVQEYIPKLYAHLDELDADLLPSASPGSYPCRITVCQLR